MRTILQPLCIPRPAGRMQHALSRARLVWDYHHYSFRAHENILAAKHRMPRENFDDYFKFAFVRNPWDTLVSRYEFNLSKPQHPRHARVKRLKDFDAFIRMQAARRDAYQLNMLCDRKGRLLMNFVGKFENLDADWKTACDAIGIAHYALPRENATKHKPYQSYYDKDTIKLVAKHWAREIEIFGYSFD